MDFTENAKYGYIAVNRSHIAAGYSSKIISPFLVHEFFHFVQLKYISGDYPVTWFNEASSSYYEYMDQKLTPDSLSANEELLFNGVYPKSNTAADGYARSSLLYYLTKRYGTNYILENYKLLGNGNYDAAFTETSGNESPSVWVADFYQKHLNGELFKPLNTSWTPYDLYVNLKSGDKLGTKADLTYSTKAPSGETAPVFGKGTLSVPGFGVRFLLLDMDTDEIAKLKDGDSIKITCDNQSITLAVFVIERDSETKQITNTLIKGTAPLVQDAKRILTDNKMLLVCAVNTSKVQVNTEIKIQPADGKTDYSGTYIGVMTNLKEKKDYEVTAQISLQYTIGNESEYQAAYRYERDGNAYDIYSRFFVQWPAGTITSFGDEYVFTVGDNGISLTATLKDFSGNDEYRIEVRKSN